MRDLIERYCMREELSTYDPYDIWKTLPGIYTKSLFNRNRIVGLVPAASLMLFDIFLNNNSRFFCSKQEYPIVRALAALSLLNLYEVTRDKSALEGAASHLAWLDTQSQKILDIEFLGYITGESKREALIKADVYIFPSYGEGMPTTVLEAMAYGLPVITRPVGGIKDFFEDGRMGFLTTSLDPLVFAKLLGKLILNPGLRSDVEKFNREYAHKRFLGSKVVTRIERIYQKVFDPVA